VQVVWDLLVVRKRVIDLSCLRFDLLSDVLASLAHLLSDLLQGSKT